MKTSRLHKVVKRFIYEEDTAIKNKIEIRKNTIRKG
jgi:hypothetical protein